MQEQIPRHVLIVDDDQAIRSYFGVSLERARYRVSTAEDTAAALRVIQSDRPDLIVLDHYLPDTDGQQFLGALRGDPQTQPIPVILLTIDNSARRYREYMENGADDYLIKPVRSEELTASVAAQLHKADKRGAQAAARAKAGGQPELRAADALAGFVPPGYEVMGKLGQGGFASAYRARHPNHPGACVLKLYPLSGAGSAEMTERMAREGEMLKRISHPNVPRMFDHGSYRGYGFLAMEFIGGDTLKQVMGAPWEMRGALRLLLRLAHGLGAAHAAQIVHRDVKPDNIILRSQSLTPVLIDFGAARDLRAPAPPVPATSVVGTPSYMAPEVIEGGAATPAADVYACGVMLYELLTGFKPFSSPNATSVLHQHLKEQVPLLPSRFAVLQPLLERMLAKTPGARPQDGAEMAAELLEMLNQVSN